MLTFKRINCWLGALSMLALSSCITVGEFSELAEDANKEKVLQQLSNDAEKAFEYSKAAEYYSRILELQPKNITATLGLARNLRYAGMAQEAIKVIKNYVSKFREGKSLQLELLKAQLAAGMLDIALKTAVELRIEDPNNWELYSIMGIIYDQKNDYDLGKKNYLKGLKISPKNPTILNNFALSLAQDGELEKAIKILEPIVLSEKTTVQTRQTLAFLYNLSGSFNKGQTLMRRDLPDEIVEQNMSVMKSF